jgi:hypothetical protein
MVNTPAPLSGCLGNLIAAKVVPNEKYLFKKPELTR